MSDSARVMKQAAILMCRASSCNARVAAMMTANTQRFMVGETLAYTEQDFLAVANEEGVCQNDVYALLQES